MIAINACKEPADMLGINWKKRIFAKLK